MRGVALICSRAGLMKQRSGQTSKACGAPIRWSDPCTHAFSSRRSSSASFSAAPLSPRAARPGGHISTAGADRTSAAARTAIFSALSAEQTEQQQMSRFDAEQQKLDEELDKSLNICRCGSNRSRMAQIAINGALNAYDIALIRNAHSRCSNSCRVPHQASAARHRISTSAVVQFVLRESAEKIAVRAAADVRSAPAVLMWRPAERRGDSGAAENDADEDRRDEKA